MLSSASSLSLEALGREHKPLTAEVYCLVETKLQVLLDTDTARYLGLHYRPGQHLTSRTKQRLTSGEAAQLGPSSFLVPQEEQHFS